MRSTTKVFDPVEIIFPKRNRMFVTSHTLNTPVQSTTGQCHSELSRLSPAFAYLPPLSVGFMSSDSRQRSSASRFKMASFPVFVKNVHAFFTIPLVYLYWYTNLSWILTEAMLCFLRSEMNKNFRIVRF